MTLGYHFLFSNWISSDGADDNNSHLGDPGKPNLISRFRGPTLGVHLIPHLAADLPRRQRAFPIIRFLYRACDPAASVLDTPPCGTSKLAPTDVSSEAKSLTQFLGSVVQHQGSTSDHFSSLCDPATAVKRQ